MTLDSVGLEAAAKALGEFYGGRMAEDAHGAEAAVRAYLAATENPPLASIQRACLDSLRYCAPEMIEDHVAEALHAAFAAGRAAATPDQTDEEFTGAAWGLIANAYGGNWGDAPDDWRGAAERWRDEYIAGANAHPRPAASPDERLREAGERLAKAVARVCGEGHPALAAWRVALAAATPDPPDESHAVKCAEARGYARGRFERDPAASPDPPDLPALDEGPLAYLLEDSAASPDERLREALDNLLAAVTDVERRGEAGLIEALDDAMNDAADLLAAADRETARPDPETEAGRRVEAARIVAEHWATWAMREGDTQYPCRMTAHPLGCVLAALDGEITPDQLGVSADSKAGAALHSLAAAGREKPDEKVRAMTLPDGEAYCPPPVSDDPTGITRLATAALAAAGREKPDEPHTQDCQDAMFMHHAATGGDMECTCRPPVSDDPVNDPETNT